MSSQPLGLWFAHIAAGQSVAVTPPLRLFVVNASLGYNIPSQYERGLLSFRRTSCDTASCIASFRRDTHEQTSLGLVLEADIQYAFNVSGPYPVDLIGYYANNHTVAADSTGRSSSSESEVDSVTNATVEKPLKTANLDENKENISNSPISGNTAQFSFKLRSSKPLSEKTDDNNLDGIRTVPEQGKLLEANPSSNELQPTPAPATPLNDDVKPTTQTPVVAKKDLYKYDKSSCAEWNIFGREYAPAQAIWPSKEAVKAAFKALPDQEQEAWKSRRLAMLIARKASRCRR